LDLVFFARVRYPGRLARCSSGSYKNLQKDKNCTALDEIHLRGKEKKTPAPSCLYIWRNSSLSQSGFAHPRIDTLAETLIRWSPFHG
jgi:hypothetical protein